MAKTAKERMAALRERRRNARNSDERNAVTLRHEVAELRALMKAMEQRLRAVEDRPTSVAGLVPKMHEIQAQVADVLARPAAPVPWKAPAVQLSVPVRPYGEFESA